MFDAEKVSKPMNALQQFRTKLGLATMSEPSTAWQLIGLGLAMGGAYHGYKRNCGSVGWAIGWGLLMASPAIFVAAPMAFAQGFGKPKSTCPIR